MDNPSPEPNPYEPPAAPINRGRAGRGRAAALRALGVVLVVISGLTAFVATCFPLGVVNTSFDHQVKGPLWYPEWVPFVGGAIAGLVAGRMAWRVWTGHLPRR